MVHCLWF